MLFGFEYLQYKIDMDRMIFTSDEMNTDTCVFPVTNSLALFGTILYCILKIIAQVEKT